MKPLRTLICGNANPHVRGYYRAFAEADYMDLVAIADPDQSRMADAEVFFKDKLPKLKFYTDWQEMFRRHPDVEAVMVGSDNIRHCEHALAAAEAGRHIFSMKVMSMDEGECQRIIDGCRKAGITLEVELELHFQPQIANLRKRLLSGAIGKLRSLYISNISQSPINYFPGWGDPTLMYGRKVPMRPGEDKVFRGGAITDHPHPFDLARWLTGSEFESVFGMSSRNMRAHLQVEDHAAISGTMRDGTKIFINPSYSHLEEKVPTRRLYWPKSLECMIKAVGDDGVLMCDFWNKPLEMLGPRLQSPNRMLWDNAPSSPEFGDTCLECFFLACRGQRKVETTGEDGLAAVRAMNASYESIYSGKAVRLI